jgi:hypothetical protein
LPDVAEVDPVEQKDENPLLASVDPQFGHSTVSTASFF